jgi:hypothetical protein
MRIEITLGEQRIDTKFFEENKSVGRIYLSRSSKLKQE